jgi:alkylated DNA nucleotide flippase Atl1
MMTNWLLALVLSIPLGLDLYMPVPEALLEWHRVLKRGGLVAFSAMKAGAPPGGRIFRDCAAMFGVSLRDPSEPLGSVSASRRVLEAAGFEVADVVSETIEFSAQDLTQAWESNSRSAGHAEVQRLSAQEQEALKDAYLNALAREEREHPGTLRQADVLYAFGRS